MPSRWCTGASITTTALFPSRTSGSDAQHVPAAKAMPEPGVTTWVTANKYKRQAPTHRAGYVLPRQLTQTHLGRLPFLHLPILASLWEQSKSSTKHSSSCPALHPLPALLAEQNHCKELQGHTTRRNPKASNEPQLKAEDRGPFSVQPFWVNNDLFLTK